MGWTRIIAIIGLMISMYTTASGLSKQSHVQNQCFSTIFGRGLCMRLYNCKAFNDNVLTLKDLPRCRTSYSPAICCPIDLAETNGNANPSAALQGNSHLRRTNPTISTTTKSPDILSRHEPAWNTEIVCNTSSRTANCVLGNRCISALGNGTCQSLNSCESQMHISRIPLCARSVYCCPLSNRKKRDIPVTKMPVEFRPIHPTSVPFVGRFCGNKVTGICTLRSQCQAILQRTSNITLRFCSLQNDVVCCPQVTTTSPNPVSITSTTASTLLTTNTKPQKRPSQKMCENYKATNPRRQKFHKSGEKETNVGEFPHVGFIFNSNDYHTPEATPFCGVALVSERFALTTANCARRVALSDVVRFGSVEIHATRGPAKGTEATLKNIWLEDENKEAEDYHDLALLEFKEDVPLTSSVHPACVRTETGDLPRSIDLQVNGWSSMDPSNDFISPLLYTSTVNTIQIESCNDTHFKLGVSRRGIQGVLHGQYCARNKKKGECDGDGGLPLSRDVDGQFEIVGILSLEFGCVSKHPSIYTRVAYYIDWIEEIVWPELSKKYIN